MGIQRRTREGYESLCLRAFPKENIILKHYMIIAWWLYLLDILGHYIILVGSAAQIMVMTNNITSLGYTYSKCRLNNPPDIFYEIAHIYRLVEWIPSMLAWNSTLLGGDQCLLCTTINKNFTGTNNQEVLNTFDTSMQYTLWDSGFTQYINPYFELNTE